MSLFGFLKFLFQKCFVYLIFLFRFYDGDENLKKAKQGAGK